MKTKIFLTCLLVAGWMAHAHSQTITGAEYYIDTDPGTGNATSVQNLVAGTDVMHILQVPTTDLNTGFHKLAIRSFGSGAWSHQLSSTFYITAAIDGGSSLITDAEYFIDADPGAGMGNAIPLSPSAMPTLAFTVPTENLSLGFHKLNVRTRDNDGQWSQQLSSSFYLTQELNGSDAELGAAEFFIDTDPGVGQGTPITLAGSATESTTLFEIPLSELAAGFHRLCIRTKDNAGFWSQQLSSSFYLTPTAIDGGTDLAAAEFFIDTDPGVGQGTPITLAGSATESTTLIEIPLSELAGGFHRLCIRAKDNAGNWSQQLSSSFYLTPAPSALPSNLVAAEWFLDADPGVGNGVSLPIGPAGEVTSNLMIELEPLNLVDADHTFNLRVQDDQGHWSLMLSRPFSICDAESTPSFTASTGCFGTPTTFTNTSLNVPADAVITWDFDGNQTDDETGSGPHSFLYTAPGVYNALLRITEGDCSVSVVNQITITAPPLAAINGLNGENTTCGDGLLTVQATGGQTYLWSTGQAGASINVGPGSYTVQATNAQGCTGSSAPFLVSALPIDDCGECYAAGESDPDWNSTCIDCAGILAGGAAIDACGICSGGSTGLVPNATCSDCNNIANGTASIDLCGLCSGGNTGLIPNASCADCSGVPNGSATAGSPCTIGNQSGTFNASCQCIVPLSNLAVSGVNTDAAVIAPSEVVILDYIVSNLGQADYTGAWTERIYIESATGTNRTQLLSAPFTPAGNLANAESLPRTRSITMPANIVVGDLGAFVVEVIPSAANPQEANSQSDNISVETTTWSVSKILSVLIPITQLTEGSAQALSATLTRSGSIAAALTVSISPDLAGRLNIPANVSIQAGQASRTFTLSAIDNADIEGNVTVNLTFDAAGFPSVSAGILIIENDLPSLSITNLPATTNEGQVVAFEVNSDLVQSAPLQVFLSATNSSRFPVPASVTIPAGANSASVSVTLVQDNIPEIAVNSLITAGAAGHIPTSATIEIQDDDVPQLLLTFQTDTVSESAGFFATQATLQRIGGPSNISYTANLSASLANTLILPPSVTLAIGESQKIFQIGVIDNALLDGFRTVEITAALFLSSCGCSTPPSDAGFIVAALTVADNDGPTLTLTANAAALPEGLANAGTLTITRNSMEASPLTVVLSSSNINELTLPATATIPASQASVAVNMTTINDGVPDGNQTVFLSASADSFSPAIIPIIVTDQNKPDLQLPSLSLNGTSVAGGQPLGFNLTVSNTGFATAATGTRLQAYLSANAVVDPSDAIILDITIPVAFPAGQTTPFGGVISIPNTPGAYQVLFRINPTSTLSELVFNNNTSPARPLTITADYTATAVVSPSFTLQGAPVTITGQATNTNGSVAALQQVEVYVLNNFTRRTILATTNDAGQYTAIFQPLSTEAGLYEIGASFPGINATAVQDAFNILGVQINNGALSQFLVPLGDTLTGTLSVMNQSPQALTNFTLSAVNVPAGANFSFDTLPSLAGNATLPIGYQIWGTSLSPGTNFIPAFLQAVADEGVIEPYNAGYFCQAAQGFIMPSITQINTSVTQGGQQFVEVKLVNSGAGSTGSITLSLPQVDWLTTITPQVMPAIAPGDTALVIFRFQGTSSIPFDLAVTGSIGINAANGNSVSMPFSFTKVASADASLLVEVVNQFTYFDEAQPKVEGANVQIKNYFSGELYAQGLTNENGEFNAVNIPQGTHRIIVTKDQHLPFEGTVTVNPGIANTRTVFLNFQAITFSWQVVPTAIEDVYDITLITEFQTDVPIPVVTLDLPDTMPQLFGDEIFAFNATLTNHGLITANDVQFILPTDDPEYEFLFNYEPADLPALSSIQIPVVMRLREVEVNTNALGGGPTIGQISQFLGMNESAYAGLADESPGCKGFGSTIYWYYCSLETGLWQQGGELFTFAGRTCPNNISLPFTGYDPSVFTGTLSCADCPTFVPGQGGSSFNYTIQPKTCLECILDIVSGAGECLGGSLGEALGNAAGAAGAAAAAGGFGPSTANGQGLNDDDGDSSVIDDAKLAFCLANALNSEDDVVGEIFGCLPLPIPPGIGCLTGLGGAFISCAGTSVGAAPSAAFEPLSNLGSGPQLNELEGFDGIPEVFDLYFQDFDIAVLAYENRELWALAYFGDMIYSDGFIVFAELARNTIENFSPFEDSLQTAILAELTGYEIDLVAVDAFFDRWNITMDAWANEQFEPTEEEPLIISYSEVVVHSDAVRAAVQHADDRGFETVPNMILQNLLDIVEIGSVESNAVCASVTIQISQQLTMTREAFSGTLTIFNGHPTDLLDSLTLNLQILDANGIPSNGLFQIEPQAFVNLSNVSGTGQIGAQQEGSVNFLFIPTQEAAPTVPQVYGFGGSITYFDPYEQNMVTIPLSPVFLTVNPSPNLYLHYFLERNILADDPLTSDIIEPTIPAELAVMIENSGFGPAVNLFISSAQPEIIANEQGLAIDFNLIGSSLQGQPANLGVTDIIFGTIPPISTRIGQWFFTSTLLGKFVDYDAEVVHNNSFGNPALSLIEGVTLHELTRNIDAYTHPDAMGDFLVNDNFDLGAKPDVIYISQGFETLPVGEAIGSFNIPVGAPSFTNTLTASAEEIGWNYLRLPDPGAGNFDIVSITRNDGQVIPLKNAWLTFVTLPTSLPPVYEDRFHFADNFLSTEEVTYTIVWELREIDTPEITAITGAPANISGVQISTLTVEFSKPIDTASFGPEDCTLFFQGQPLDVTSANTTFNALNATTIEVDLSALTNGNGTYVFTAQATGVVDQFGIAGTEGEQVIWTQFVSVPAVESYPNLPLNGLASSFDTLKFLFNLPLDLSTIDASDFSILQSGAEIPADLTITSLSADGRLFGLSGLAEALASDGTYDVVVDLTALTTANGVPGLADQSVSLTLDSQGPSVENFTLVNTGGIDAQHIPFVDILFDENVFGFTTADLTLTRNGENIQLVFTQLSIQTFDFWKAGSFDFATYPDGDYTFSVNLAGITDALGNPGSGVASIDWIVNRNSTLAITGLGIDPDRGISTTDGITSGLAMNAVFTLTDPAAQVVISQLDFAAEYPLAILTNLAAGAHSIPISFPTGGTTALKVTATSPNGFVAVATRTLFIDQTPISGQWLQPNGLNFDQQIEFAELSFTSAVLNDANILANLSFTRNGASLPTAGLDLTSSGVQNFVLSNINEVSPLPGVYQLSLPLSSIEKASSGIAGLGSINLIWTVNNVNAAPVANAGSNFTVTAAGNYQLSALASTDPEGNALSFQWVSPVGLTLSDLFASEPSFNINSAQDGQSFTFLVIVSDGSLFSTASVTVLVDLPDGVECPDLALNNGDPCEIDELEGTVLDCACVPNDLENGSFSASVPYNASCGERTVSIYLFNAVNDELIEQYDGIFTTDGSLEFTIIPIGNYDIVVKIQGFLAVAVNDVEIIPQGIAIELDTPILGDINGDNMISLLDVSLLNCSFGLSVGDEMYNPIADLNCDGSVNLIDASLLNATFGLMGIPLE